MQQMGSGDTVRGNPDFPATRPEKTGHIDLPDGGNCLEAPKLPDLGENATWHRRVRARAKWANWGVMGWHAKRLAILAMEDQGTLGLSDDVWVPTKERKGTGMGLTPEIRTCTEAHCWRTRRYPRGRHVPS
jgi:hypothetical protein